MQNAKHFALCAVMLNACVQNSIEQNEIDHETDAQSNYLFSTHFTPYQDHSEKPVLEDLDIPNKCDPLILVKRKDGSPRLSKKLPDWYGSENSRSEHQNHIRKIIYAVAYEMGADEMAAELLFRKAILESSGNEGALHLLDGDVAAAEKWEHYALDLTAERWTNARIPVFVVDNGELVSVIGKSGRQITHGAWSIGRGLYGMITPYYVPRYLGKDAPPWSLCDPAIATITAIWSVRRGLERCRTNKMRDAYRWLSAGTCKVRSENKEKIFDRLAKGKVRGLRLKKINSESKVDFGDRWPIKVDDHDMPTEENEENIIKLLEAVYGQFDV